MRNKLGLLLALPILLCGCATSTGISKVKDGDEVVLKGTSTAITKQDFYKQMMNYQNYDSLITSELTKDILELEGIACDGEDSYIEEQLENLKESYGDLYDTLIEYNGGENAVKKNLSASYYYIQLRNNYIDLNVGALISEHNPIVAQVATFSDEETANEFCDTVSQGGDFEETAIELGSTTSGAATVIQSDDEDLNSTVWDYISSENNWGTLSTVMTHVVLAEDSSTESEEESTETHEMEEVQYIVVNAIGRDLDGEYSEDLYNALGEHFEDTEMYEYYFAKHDIEFYDQNVYDLMSETYPMFDKKGSSEEAEKITETEETDSNVMTITTGE